MVMEKKIKFKNKNAKKNPKRVRATCTASSLAFMLPLPRALGSMRQRVSKLRTLERFLAASSPATPTCPLSQQLPTSPGGQPTAPKRKRMRVSERRVFRALFSQSRLPAGAHAQPRFLCALRRLRRSARGAGTAGKMAGVGMAAAAARGPCWRWGCTAVSFGFHRGLCTLFVRKPEKAPRGFPG